MAYDVKVGARITEPVDRRLRLLALVKGQALSHVLDALLDQHLPPAIELASMLSSDDQAVA